jgi:hypothetical protein
MLCDPAPTFPLIAIAVNGPAAEIALSRPGEPAATGRAAKETGHADAYTLGGMAREPATPPPSERRDSAPPLPADEPTGADERYGPLALARHTKDDGRALLLFTRAERGAT